MKKVSFDELENTLTRTEMKNIMAGSGGDCKPHNCIETGQSCIKWTGTAWVCSNCCLA